MAKARLDMVEGIMDKYEIPLWVKPYIYQYIKRDPIGSIKRAVSFIDVKRKRGEVTKEYVKLPNSIVFDMDSVIHILSIFLYGEERCADIYARWVKEPAPENIEYPKFYAGMSDVSTKRARAIKNLIEGIGQKGSGPTSEIIDVFDYIESIKGWRERFLCTNLILNYSYGVSFGRVFYRIFYFVMPEYMRTFGKAFDQNAEYLAAGNREAMRIVSERLIPEEDIIKITRELLSKILRSIDSEMRIAKRAKIENEAILLRTIAIIYPLHTLADLGLNIDVDKEFKNIERMTKAAHK